MPSPSRTDPARYLRASVVALGVALAACGGSPTGPATRVSVPKGSSFGAATDSLARAGIIESPRLFRMYAKVTGRDRALKPGTYLLRPGTSWSDLLEALTEGKGLVRSLTIPEGWSLAQIVPALARSLAAPVESVRVAVADSALRQELDVPTPTLEGYLFPDTYTFQEGTSPRVAVTMMVRRFQQKWKPEWSIRMDSLPMNRHDIVTLASIVEREARVAEERPVIAAVYLNRLRKGMMLQADPTVQYARGQHTSRVMYNDLRIASPYNTYRNRGLPPGPIASPGEASLQAALYPADVPYLFFVAHPDGHHEFRTTFTEHMQAVSAMRRAREAAGLLHAQDSGRRPVGADSAASTKSGSTTSRATTSRSTKSAPTGTRAGTRAGSARTRTPPR
jgi:UPF0755 protein